VKSAGLVDDKTLITKFQPVTGSEDFPNLFADQPTVKTAYKFLGTADPEVFAKARAEGKEVPFANHQPIYLVDLNAIPLGAKIGTVSVMGLMAKANQ